MTGSAAGGATSRVAVGVAAGVTGRALLDLWDHVEGLSPQQRALALAEAVAGEPLGNRPVGRRDACLLALHEELSGPVLDAVVSCPGCAEETEFTLDTPVLRKSAEQVEARGDVAVGSRRVAWRVPTGDDLVDLEAIEDPEAAAAELLARCTAGAEDGAPLTGDERAAVTAAIADADPLAEVLVELTCPGCDRPFVADVDVADFATRAVRDAARRLLEEVDALARAYGWTEPEVLALSDRRRAAYLRLLTDTVEDR